MRAPGLFADSWQCATHGAVHPLQPIIPPSVNALTVVVNHARVPVWMPWPLPVGWLFTGVARAGDDRDGGGPPPSRARAPDRWAAPVSCC